MANIPTNIPEKTIERLSEYRRTLLSCHRQGITHVFSHVLAGIHGSRRTVQHSAGAGLDLSKDKGAFLI